MLECMYTCGCIAYVYFAGVVVGILAAPYGCNVFRVVCFARIYRNYTGGDTAAAAQHV